MSATFRLLESIRRQRRPLRILGASGQLGYGIPTPALEEGLRRNPDMIGCDMGSIDIGPYYLGSGKMAPTVTGAKRDLRKVLLAARRLDIPLIIGSAGSAGARPHLDATLALVREIAAEEGLSFRLAHLAADIPRDLLHEALAANRISPMDTMPPLTAADIDGASQIVAQMGVASLQRALETGADVVIAGRACDTAIFATLPIMMGFPAGLATHMAKIVECASLCCVPGGRDTILAELDDEGFTLESMAPERAATPGSVAAHSLYEQADPFDIREPAGRTDLREVRYEVLDARRTRVSGARFEPVEVTRVKLEGAVLQGYRALLLAGVADPRFIAARNEIYASVCQVVRDLVSEGRTEDYTLTFRSYGLDAVVAQSGPAPDPREIFVLGECVAPTMERAEEVIATTKQYLLHHGYEGRISTAGNLAFPFTPPEVRVGPAYRFNVFHLLQMPDSERLFPLTVEEIGAPHQQSASPA